MGMYVVFAIVGSVALILFLLIYNEERHMHDGCTKLFGIWKRRHVQDSGYYSNMPGYGVLRQSGIDGTGRKHGDVYVKCARCDKDFMLVKLHEHPEKNR